MKSSLLAGTALLAAVAAFTIGDTVSAGVRSSSAVTITVSGTTKTAFGMMGTARNSADGSQRIGCALSASGATLTMQCSAANALGTTAVCTSTLLANIRAVESITENAAISFTADAAGQCTAVLVGTDSSFEPGNS